MSTLSKKSLTCIFLCLAMATIALGQKPLTNSRQSSFYTYIYKLNVADVSRFYTTGNKTPDDKILHTLVDSFKTDRYWENTLPPGNYLKVRAEKNDLKYDLIENHSIFLKMFPGALEKRFALADKQGNYIKEASVSVNGKPLARDNKSDTWFFKNRKDTTIVQVDFDGVSNFFSVVPEDSYSRDDDRETNGWLGQLWLSVKKWFAKKPKSENYRQRYTSFMVFNKPIYKPGDTVKFKAFILDAKSKKPVSIKKLSVQIGRYGDDHKTLGLVNSYRDGGFEYSFKLVDSLELDERYEIKLVDESIKPAKADDQDDKDEKDKANTYASGEFRYEEYELKAIHFDTRLDKDKHWQGSPLAIYLKATDENNLPVPDGRVTLTLTTDRVNRYKDEHTFVKDTLWVHKLALDEVGETKVVVPDSIFPPADITYKIAAVFLNSNNEQQVDFQSASYNYERFHTETELLADSLKVTYSEDGKPKNMIAYISALDADDDTLSKVKINLPGLVKINPNAASYNIITDSNDTDIELKDHPAGISLSGERTADSIFVQITNERKLPFFCSVFDGNKLIDAGQNPISYYRKACKDNRSVTFILTYNWAGKLQKQEAKLAYFKNRLNIAVRQPVSVYPGQKVQTDIVVTDITGKPVPNTDLTAWSITKKFEDYRIPYLLYLGKNYPSVKKQKQYEVGDDYLGGGFKLDWARRGKQLGLDSIEYFKFTHPKNLYSIVETGIDTVTQIAPFVTRNGDILPVHILYIDERPVFFSQAKQYQPYSFKVSPGIHTLRFRTGNQNIKLDSVNILPSKKLILSINADAYASVKMPDTLTLYESQLLNKYMITVVNNFEEKRATIVQNDRIFLLNPTGQAQQEILTGPLNNNYTFFDRQDIPMRQFLAEPGYSYTFTEDLLKQKSIRTPFPFNKNLVAADGLTDYRQYVLTNEGADSLWQDYLDKRANTTSLFTNNDKVDGPAGNLSIERETGRGEVSLLIKNAIIYKYDEPDFIKIYPGNTRNFGKLAIGKYRVLYILKGDGYDIKENIEIKPYGINHYHFVVKPSHKRDSVSIKINHVIANRKSDIYRNADYRDNNDALKLKEAFNEKYLDIKSFKSAMSGIVIGTDDKLPIPGVAVVIKGTSIGTTTDAQGRFMLNVPANGKLSFTFIGFVRKEANISPGKTITVLLEGSKNFLSEVVVVGYGVQTKRSVMGYATTSIHNIGATLSGKVAGLQIVLDSTIVKGSVRIVLRGNRSSTGNNEVLIVVDGIIVPNMNMLSPADIDDISVLNQSSGIALYGAGAANGVIVIRTKSKNNEKEKVTDTEKLPGQQTLRKNFNDYAYWQPKLTTDENGKASFTSVFPDDITNWRTFVIGINGNKQSGFAESNIKSFKPLSANFIAPQFAVEGDEMKLIGKVMNYNSTPATVTRSFIYNGKALKQNVLEISNSKIDTLNITASATDSLAFEYSIKRDNNYFDGERRSLPVFKQGVKETKGSFDVLNGDTTLTLKFDPKLGPVSFRAEASVLPALAEEARKLREYKYLCNEQLASKLKGLLAEKRIKIQLNEPFIYEKNIKDIIKKLQENRKSTGAWGWWKDSDGEPWISLHVIEALLDAKNMDYDVLLYAQKLTDYLVYQIESYNGQDKLACVQIMRKLKATVDYKKYADMIAKEQVANKFTSNYERLKLMLLKTELGLKVNVDSLIATKRNTLFGNIYWGDDNYRFFDNSIQLTVLAYKIIKAEGKHPQLLNKMRGYFLEQRRLGEWRNTYESALILETILPDVLGEGSKVQPSVLTLKGNENKTINKFPYADTLRGNQITLSKTGTLPVYVTGYQQFWNSKPAKVSKDFTVDSWFEKAGKKISKLKGGEAVTLNIEVTAKGDGDYVMVEVPIPAGCSYEEKNQQWANNEVHREHFKEKMSIFCSKLKQGKYTFTISLMPRYSGTYTLNPAKAELMYFPTFYGREGMKKIVIGD